MASGAARHDLAGPAVERLSRSVARLFRASGFLCLFVLRHYKALRKQCEFTPEIWTAGLSSRARLGRLAGRQDRGCGRAGGQDPARGLATATYTLEYGLEGPSAPANSWGPSAPANPCPPWGALGRTGIRCLAPQPDWPTVPHPASRAAAPVRRAHAPENLNVLVAAGRPPSTDLPNQGRTGRQGWPRPRGARPMMNSRGVNFGNHYL